MSSTAPIPDLLRQQIVSLQEDITTKSEAAEEAQKKSDGYKSDAVNYRETQMKFWDRWFFGWFGKKETVKAYKNLKSLTAEFNTKAEDLRAQAKAVDAEADNKIHGFLRQSDPHYTGVSTCHDKAVETKNVIGQFMSTVDNALDEIDDAQNTEMMDMFSKNKGISVISYMENQEAGDAIKDVRRALPAFQKALESYNVTVKEFDSSAVRLTDVGDGFDLMLDFAFEGFDFMSLFTLNKLSNAESDMEDLRSKVQSVQSNVSQHVEKSGNYLQSYRNNVRGTCLGS
jgi:hypothetical protein